MTRNKQGDEIIAYEDAEIIAANSSGGPLANMSPQELIDCVNSVSSLASSGAQLAQSAEGLVRAVGDAAIIIRQIDAMVYQYQGEMAYRTQALETKTRVLEASIDRMSDQIERLLDRIMSMPDDMNNDAMIQTRSILLTTMNRSNERLHELMMQILHL